MMLLYSLALTLTAVLGMPWWLVRLRRSPEEKTALAERLGRLPSHLTAGAASFRNVWLHAVSVGEVLAATLLVRELSVALEAAAPGPLPWRVLVSTTTVTGQGMARQRFGLERTFYNPLDLGTAVRACLDALRPRALILMEGELWPRLLEQCAHRGIPAAVVNARISDRSLRRSLPLRRLWRRMLGGGVSLWCAQSATDADRLRQLGAEPSRIVVTGNLKYDVRAPERSVLADRLRHAINGRPVIVCGSTTGDANEAEEALLLREALPQVWELRPDALVVIAPRHPERFDAVVQLAEQVAGPTLRASAWMQQDKSLPSNIRASIRVLILDTLGDLAAVYALADAAFVGGSLLSRGGHNPLEPAQFGVPVVTGPSEENFRDVTSALRDAGGLLTGQTAQDCGRLLTRLLADPEHRRQTGERARLAFEQQGGATARTIQPLVRMILSAHREAAR